ncbi:uncharacterized protein [Haliotis asinina]|uniref:uncharacterized protein n=1 Tax=Haliotis asinina TaxID=109174 RepID=UPI0035319DA3
MKVIIAALSVLVCSAFAQVPISGKSLVGGPLGLGFNNGDVIGNAGVGGKGYGYNDYGKRVAAPFVAGHGTGLVGHGSLHGLDGPFDGHGPVVGGHGIAGHGKINGGLGVVGTGYDYSTKYGSGKGIGRVGPFVAGHGNGPFAVGNGPFVAGKGYGHDSYSGLGNGFGLVGLLGHAGRGIAGPLAVGNVVAGQGHGYGYNPYNNNYGYGKNVGHGVAGHGLISPFGVGQLGNGVGIKKVGFGGAATGHYY